MSSQLDRHLAVAGRPLAEAVSRFAHSATVFSPPPSPRAAQVGCVLAAYVVETVGTQEYSFTAEQFLARVEESYGAEAAAEVAPHLEAIDA